MYSQCYGFSSSYVWMWELDHKEGWALKNWCFPNVVLKKTLESPLDSKKIKSVSPKGNQPWVFIGRTDAEADAPILWHLIQRANSLEKTLMLWKFEGRRKRGRQRMRWLDGITDLIDMSFSTQGDSDGQRSLACCGSWGLKELDLTVTEQQMHQFKKDKRRKNWWKGNRQLTRGTASGQLHENRSTPQVKL